MKTLLLKLSSYYSALALVIVTMNTYSQIPHWSNNLNNNPSTPAELAQSNQIIARAFAPVLYQMTSAAPPESLDGLSDRPVRVNYDGDWNHLNNWDNAEQISQEGGFPAAYYAVLWTEKFWLITYSYYFARDYAITLCPKTSMREIYQEL